jgi:hypothetical protein
VCWRVTQGALELGAAFTSVEPGAVLDHWLCDGHSPLPVSRFPLALSPKTKRTRSYTSCESTHVTSGVNTRQTPSNLTGIRTMEITAWQSDALSSRDRRGSGRRGLSRRSGRMDIDGLTSGTLTHEMREAD